ncbi:hypothetical protein F8O04_06750 [Pseudoclavibacter endophyticus]|uniref:Integral membrane protein n=1 Tax=Pseudoclavibacter endophyticus TaxID=1778590 RepID=A0A6H9WNU6_9MICO|nr:hypothetical protein F8O04_06750 [Pseudoclavibacter endophyticus]
MGAPRAHGGFRGASGVGRVLVLVYAVLALAATGRSTLQLLTKFDEAPVAYVLSAVAAVVYVVATVALVVRGRTAHVVATIAIAIEFAGVLAVGILTEVVPGLFPADTVWSHFGRGYAFIPLLLPIFGIAWLESQRTTARITDVRHHRPQ